MVTVIVLSSLMIIMYAVSSLTAKNIAEISELKAVTHFDGIEEYYRSLKRRKSKNPPQEIVPLKRSASIKKEICRNIFTSHYFKMLSSKDWIELDDVENRTKFRNNHREIFDLIYVQSQSQQGEDNYEYENAYRSRRVIYNFIVEENPDFEYSFCCIVRDRDSNRLEPYFVSQEFNVNLNQFDASPIAGRFIFSSNGPDGMHLEAMAEEAAVAGSEVARLMLFTAAQYEFTRSRNSLNPTPDFDPICQLSVPNKLRLCTSLFSAQAFKNKVVFVPTIENVQVNCVRRNVWISLSWKTFAFILQRMDSEFIHEEFGIIEEWMIGCKASIPGNDDQTVYYYVSGSDKPNMIYVHTNTSIDHVKLLYNSFDNVSVSTGIEHENNVRFLLDDVEE